MILYFSRLSSADSSQGLGAVIIIVAKAEGVFHNIGYYFNKQMQKSQAISKNCQAKLGLAIFGDCLTFYSIPAIIFAKMPAISLFLLALIAALVIESLSSYRAVEMQRSRL